MAKEIRTTSRIPCITHPSLDGCECDGIDFREGRGAGGAWVSIHCHHCGRGTPWQAVAPGDTAHRRQFEIAADHSQDCWTNPRGNLLGLIGS